MPPTTFLSLVLALGLSSCVQATGLADSMRARGRAFIGTAFTHRGDAAEEAIISNKNDFSSISPENIMKMAWTQPHRGRFEFNEADRYVDWAQQKGYQIYCNNLIWHTSTPDWVKNGNFNRCELISIMHDHITTVVTHFKGKCNRWEVVNEAVFDSGKYRDSVYYKTIGEEYIPWAFYFAHKADPQAKLFYNDYNLEYNSPKTVAARNIVKLVQNFGHGARIDGVGLQGHLAMENTRTSEPAPSQATLDQVLTGFTDLNIDVAYTEIDVRMTLPSNAHKEALQTAVYNRIATSCLRNRRCIGMTLWGVVDKYSWIPFRGEGSANLWDNSYKRKRAYHGFLNGINSGGGASGQHSKGDDE